MKDFIDFIFPIFLSVFISFIMICFFFGVVVEKIDILENFHKNEICSECGQVLYN